MTSISEAKREIRRLMRRKRQQLSPGQRRKAGRGLARKATRLLRSHRKPHIAIYFSSDGEIPTQPLLAALLNQGITVYLPVLHPIYHNRLWFVRYRKGDTLRPNRYGIPEPILRSHRRRTPWSLTHVCLPLVAFDDEGFRLGMGGGYYDRTFDPRRPAPRWPRLTGLAYEFQRQEKLPRGPWDVPLDAVVTDKQIRLFRHRRAP